MAESISARFQMESYGFETRTKLNGQAMEIKSGSTSRILLAKNNPALKSAPPETIAKHAILREGVNTIEVEYKNTDTDFSRLTGYIYPPGFPAPVFFLYSKEEGADKIRVNFEILTQPPSNFKPVFAYKNTGCIFVKTAGCNLSSKLNGRLLEQNLGVPESAIGFEFEAGRDNKLEVVIKSDKKQLAEYAVATCKGLEFFSQELKAKVEIKKIYQL